MSSTRMSRASVEAVGDQLRGAPAGSAGRRACRGPSRRAGSPAARTPAGRRCAGCRVLRGRASSVKNRNASKCEQPIRCDSTTSSVPAPPSRSGQARAAPRRPAAGRPSPTRASRSSRAARDADAVAASSRVQRWSAAAAATATCSAVTVATPSRTSYPFSPAYDAGVLERRRRTPGASAAVPPGAGSSSRTGSPRPGARPARRRRSRCGCTHASTRASCAAAAGRPGRLVEHRERGRRVGFPQPPG